MVDKLGSNINSWAGLDPDIRQNRVEYYTDLFSKTSTDVVYKKRLKKWELTVYRRKVLKLIDSTNSFANWQDGEIFMLDLWEWEKVSVVKRKDTSWREISCHKKATELLNQIDSGVKVPELYDSFIDWDSEYIVMEYIDWKTLYNLSLEKIVEKIITETLEKDIEWVLQLDLERFRDDVSINGKVNFKTDRDAETYLKTILLLLYSNGVIKDDPRTETYNWSMKSYLTLEKTYNKYFDNINVFSEEDWRKLWSKIRTALTHMNSHWFSHRDLWWNMRNIMFEYNTDWEIVPVIIDFWKSTFWNWWIDYESPMWQGTYVKDINILQIINRLSWDESKEEEFESDVSKNEKIVKLWKSIWLDIVPNDIRIANNLKWSIDLRVVLIDFIEKKDAQLTNYSWIIYKSTKDVDKIKSNAIWRKRVLLIISMMDSKERSEMLRFIEWILYQNPAKNTKKFFLANLFKEYLQLTEEN